MKKRILKIASMIIVLLMMITPISAHPGRTDANGGHYCRTNCDDWGGKYMQKILLNDLLHLDEKTQDKTRIKFNIPTEDNDPLELYKDNLLLLKFTKQ